jgi:hypothetical protein
MTLGITPTRPVEAHQRGREIAATGAAHKAGVMIKGEHGRQAVLAEKLGHHLEDCLSIELGPDLPMQPDGGACIDEVGNLDDMRPLTLWIGRHVTSIFQVELDFLARLP